MDDPSGYLWFRSVVTGNNPQAALTAALAELPLHPGFWMVDITHSPDCPSLGPGGAMDVCNCEIVHLTVDPWVKA